ncbi:ISL3 family transposase, partial [Jatrophihabitans sp. YIM 134969]
MRDASLWRAVLGVDDTVVDGVVFDQRAQHLVIDVHPARKAQRRCGKCGVRCPGYDRGAGVRR